MVNAIMGKQYRLAEPEPTAICSAEHRAHGEDQNGQDEDSLQVPSPASEPKDKPQDPRQDRDDHEIVAQGVDQFINRRHYSAESLVLRNG